MSGEILTGTVGTFHKSGLLSESEMKININHMSVREGELE